MDNCKSFDALDFLRTINFFIQSHALELALEKIPCADEPAYQQGFILGAERHAYCAGYKLGSNQIDWNPDSFLRIFPELSDSFNKGLAAGISEIDIVAVKKANFGVLPRTTVFCPRGCGGTWVFVTDPDISCKSCGQVMS